MAACCILHATRDAALRSRGGGTEAQAEEDAQDERADGEPRPAQDAPSERWLVPTPHLAQPLRKAEEEDKHHLQQQRRACVRAFGAARGAARTTSRWQSSLRRPACWKAM